MIESPLLAPLMAAVGAASLLHPGLSATGGTAITVSAITLLADPEHRLASYAAANPLPKNHFAMCRHPCTQVGLDNGNRSMAG